MLYSSHGELPNSSREVVDDCVHHLSSLKREASFASMIDFLRPHDDDLSAFGSIVPGPVDPPISMPAPPAQTEPAGIDEPSTGVKEGEDGSSPVAVLSPPQPHHELGSDWQFGAGKGKAGGGEEGRGSAIRADKVERSARAVAGCGLELNVSP